MMTIDSAALNKHQRPCAEGWDVSSVRKALMIHGSFTPLPHRSLTDARGFGIGKECLASRKFCVIQSDRQIELNDMSFNLLNRSYWGSANSNVSSMYFRKVTGAGPGRLVRMGIEPRF